MRKALFFILIFLSNCSISQTVIQMKREGGVSIIPCKVNGLKLSFIFDTGASDVSISLTEASFMLKNGYLDTLDIIGTSDYLDAIGNINEGVVVNIKEIEIAGLKLYNVRASIIKNIKAPLLFGQSAISKLGPIKVDLELNTLTILNKSNTYDYSMFDTNERHNSLIENNLIITEGDYFDEIEIMAKDRDYHGIISNCYNILSLNPLNDTAYFWRGYAKQKLGNFESAIEDFNKSIGINPKSSMAFCFRGLAKKELNLKNEALIDYNKSIILNSRNDIAYDLRAGLKYELNNYKGSIKDYDKAIELDPKYSFYYSHRAFIKSKNKDYIGALSDYNKAIQLGIDKYDVFQSRGEIKAKLNNFLGALVDYNKSIELNSEIGYTYYLRGIAKEELNDFSGAIKDYIKARELDSTIYSAEIRKVFLEQKIKENKWIKIISEKENDWYIKNDYENKEGSIILLWIKAIIKKTDFRINGQIKYYTNVTMLVLGEFDCLYKKTKFNSIRYYNSKGNLLQKSDEGLDWENITPDTVMESILNKTCELYN